MCIVTFRHLIKSQFTQHVGLNTFLTIFSKTGIILSFLSYRIGLYIRCGTLLAYCTMVTIFCVYCKRILVCIYYRTGWTIESC